MSFTQVINTVTEMIEVKPASERVHIREAIQGTMALDRRICQYAEHGEAYDLGAAASHALRVYAACKAEAERIGRRDLITAPITAARRACRT